MKTLKIKSVKEINNNSMEYDIEVDETSCFFVNNILVHNSSSSFYWYKGEYGVCSRKLDLIEDDKNSMWKFARENKLFEKLGKLNKNLVLQGEIIGENIQSNKYKLKGQTVRFFRIKDIDSNEYLPYDKMEELIHQLDLETVPILDWEYVLPSSIDEILEYATAKSMLNPDTIREGVVFVLYDPKYQGRVSFKAISNDFIEKYGE